MDSSSEELGPTEGAVLALLDFLVDPLLPTRSSSRETITPSQEELVAKQVHAVVLLYNYHHRKQHPDLEFLDFHSFCKLAVALKPSLQPYFKLIQQKDYSELDDVDKHLSLTEKAIMNACDTSKSLDASNNYPNIEDWPVTKVAVFLVDSRIENCYLFHSSITQGVWSAIEKEIDSSQGPEAVTEARPLNKKARVLKKALKDNQTAAGSFQQLAYLAVRETCGINQCDLKILDSHLVYSTSQAKTAVRLFMMQCTQTNQNVNLVPINDVMDSLQGPLVRKDPISWIFTPVVEYFHLLPFADKVSDCITREMSQSSAQQFDAEEDGNCNNFHLQAEQLSNPSFDIEIVKEIENGSGSPSKEETLLEIPEQNCTILNVEEDASLRTPDQDSTISRLKEEPFLYISESFKTTKEVGNGNSNHLREENVPYIRTFSEASEPRNGNSDYLKKESLPYVSQPSGVLEDMEVLQNVSSIHKNKDCCPHNSKHPEAETIVKNNCISRRKREPVVYKKRNKLQKNSNSSKTPGSKTTNTHADSQRKAEVQGKADASSQNADVVAQKTDQMAMPEVAIVVADIPVTSSKECDIKKNSIAMSDQDEKHDHAPVSADTEFKNLRKIQLTLASKEKLISQAALNVLMKKREQLSLQNRSITDEIALCDRSIQTILSGNEDDLALKIDSILEGCNEICVRTAGAADQGLTLPKGKKLSEARLCAQSPCRELDGICNTNFWNLPTYNLSASEGGFKATATVKGVEFECSSEGTLQTDPHEARNSAASNVLVKLRSMATKS